MRDGDLVNNVKEVGPDTEVESLTASEISEQYEGGDGGVINVNGT